MLQVVLSRHVQTHTRAYYFHILITILTYNVSYYMYIYIFNIYIRCDFWNFIDVNHVAVIYISMVRF